MPTEVIGGSVVSKLRRRTRVTTLALLAAASLGLSACTGSGLGLGAAEANSVDAGLAGRIDEAVSSAMTQSGSTAAIVGVWTGSAGDYVRAYGEGVAANAAIRGGQATQPVMCALLLELVDDGVVELDREVSQDVSRQVGIEGITYGQLCTGQSGLADFKGRISDIFVNNPTRPWSDRELLAHGLAHSPLPWPGLDVYQSDTAAVLLARALHQATGASIPDLLETHVFSKVEMPASYYPGEVLSDVTLPAGGLTGLTYPAAGGVPQCEVGVVEVPEVSPSMLGAAGATVTTVTDLKNFTAGYVGGQFGSEKSPGIVTQVLPTTNPLRNETGEPIADTEEGAALLAAAEDPNGQKWGFGLEKVQSLYGLSGQMTGTLTASYHDPETGFSVVVVLNNSSIGSGFVRTLAFELAAIAAESGAGPAVNWTAEEFAASRAGSAICQPAAEEPAPKG